MTHLRSALCAVVAASGGMSAAAHGAILFSYEDPTALVREFTYLQPQGPGFEGSLTYNSSVVHRFVIDATEEAPGVRVTVDATLVFTANVGTVTQVGNLFIANTAGTFEFLTTEPTPRVILSGTFDDGVLTTFLGSGSAVAARNDIGGSLLLTAGPAMFDLLSDEGYDLPGGIDPIADASASWSMVNIHEPITSETLVDFGDDSYFPDFAADNAFVARAQALPSPGALVLLTGAAAMVLTPRRRRSA